MLIVMHDGNRSGGRTRADRFKSKWPRWWETRCNVLRSWPTPATSTSNSVRPSFAGGKTICTRCLCARLVSLHYRCWSNPDGMAHTRQANIEFRASLSVIELLSTADQREDWHEHALPMDDLCRENAIILDRFNRYPLIIDPSGQATEYLMSMYKDRRVCDGFGLNTGGRGAVGYVFICCADHQDIFPGRSLPQEP